MPKINDMIRDSKNGFEDEPYFNMSQYGTGMEKTYTATAPGYDMEEEDRKIGRPIMQVIREGWIDRSEYKIAITAMGVSLGSLAITSEERAKTITIKRPKDPPDPEEKARKEAQHIHERLGIDATSVPDNGETPVVLAALAVIKMALFNDFDLNTITEVNLATESARELSKNMTIKVIDYVNRASDILESNGIHVGHIKSDIHTNQYQNACASGMQEIFASAKDGLSTETKKLVITSDEAGYVEGTPPTESGGAGAIAFVLESSSNTTKGIFVSSKFLGAANTDSTEFVKNELLYLGAGLSIMNVHPILFGNHSNYTKLDLDYRALVSAMKATGIQLNKIEYVMAYDIITHNPYPVMATDSVAYFLRHLARTDPVLHDRLFEQTGMIETLLPGFKDLETEFEFLHKVGEVYIYFDKIMARDGAIDRLKASDLDQIVKSAVSSEIERYKLESATHDHATEQILSSFEASAKGISLAKLLTKKIENPEALRQAASASADELKKIADDYRVSGELLKLINDTSSGLTVAASDSGLNLDTINNVLTPLRKHIEEFEKHDTEYNALVRKRSSDFKKLVESMHVEEEIAYAKKVGNIDTGSSELALISHIVNTDNKKPILANGYGSTSTSLFGLMIARNIEEMKRVLKGNMDYEFSRRKEIKAESYERLMEQRHGISPVNGDLPIAENAIRGYINKESLVRMAKDVIAIKNSESVQTTPAASQSTEQVMRSIRLRNKQVC